MATQNEMLSVCAKMPPLRHSIPGRDFNIMESEVCNWMINQDSIRQLIFTLAQSRGFIEFNKITHKWQGIDNED